jgi:anti-sigma factor RsiW
MDCQQAKELFVDYTDGALAPQSRSDFEAHVAQCPSCRQELDAYSKTLEEMSGLIQLAPNDGFTSRVKKTIGRRSKGRFFGDESSYSLKFAIISFILILVVLLAYTYISEGRNIALIDSAPDQTDEGR